MGRKRLRPWAFVYRPDDNSCLAIKEQVKMLAGEAQ